MAITTFYSGLITSGSEEIASALPNAFHVEGARDNFLAFYLFFYPNRQPASVKQRAPSAEMKMPSLTRTYMLNDLRIPPA